MARFVDRRTFLKRGGAAALGIMGAPLLASSRAAAAGERLVVAVGQWGIETPFAWRTSQSEKCLWDQTYDSLITRDPKTFDVPSGARHRVEALERDADVDVQAALGRARSTRAGAR